MRNLFTLVILVFSLQAYAQELKELSQSIEKPANKKKKSLIQEEKENEVIDYSNIKKVLETDGLENHKKRKDKELKKMKSIKSKRALAKYAYPKEKDFWSFMSEYWLVKNAQTLQWDSSRPEYGIKAAFKGLLEKLGYYQQKFKILIVNTPDITHMGLPSDQNEAILIISLPFMRTLDLTKVDISLLLLEDFFRIQEEYFIENLKADLSFIGDHFVQSKMKIKYIKDLSAAYEKVIYKTGFEFQQQYKVTKKMDRLLKSEPALWSSYIKLLNKIDRLVKSNLLYKKYNNIFPSPQLQIKWLTPKKKVI